MRNLNWIRAGAVAAAAFGLVATSSGASAQKANWAYCSQYATNVCSRDEYGNPITLTPQCYEAQFAACLASFARLETKTPGDYDKRYAEATAARPARLR